MLATNKDLIKLGVRTLRQRGTLRDVYKRRYSDTANNNTHDCGSYSYTTTARPIQFYLDNFIYGSTRKGG